MMLADILDIEQAFSGFKCIGFIKSPNWILEKVHKAQKRFLANIFQVYSIQAFSNTESMRGLGWARCLTCSVFVNFVLEFSFMAESSKRKTWKNIISTLSEEESFSPLELRNRARLTAMKARNKFQRTFLKINWASLSPRTSTFKGYTLLENSVTQREIKADNHSFFTLLRPRTCEKRTDQIIQADLPKELADCKKEKDARLRKRNKMVSRLILLGSTRTFCVSMVIPYLINPKHVNRQDLLGQWKYVW